MSAMSLLSCFDEMFVEKSLLDDPYYLLGYHLPSLVLLGVVGADLYQRLRFPWTHWLGVATHFLWFSVSWLILFLSY